MQKTVQKIVELTVGSKPSMPGNRPKKTVEKSVEQTVQETVGGNRRESTVRLVIDLETGTVKVKL